MAAIAAISEMRIPKSLSQILFQFTIAAIVVSFYILAIVNLFNLVAIVPSAIWLALVPFMVWSGCRCRGVLTFMIDNIGALVGRQFVEVTPRAVTPGEIRFVFKVLGHRFIHCSIALNTIESVECNAGQATDQAGRDMNDWHVVLWFDHNDAAKSLRQNMLRKPDQEVYVVGPDRRKKVTEAFGLSFVEFLRAAGVILVPGEKDDCFVRSESARSIQ